MTACVGPAVTAAWTGRSRQRWVRCVSPERTPVTPLAPGAGGWAWCLGAADKPRVTPVQDSAEAVTLARKLLISGL